MGWILHPRILPFPHLAQALCSPVRGWWRLARYRVYNNINRIPQQVMQQHALDIAKNYQDKQRWVAAAQTLRAPFWDWATNSVPPPQVIQQETITILAAPGGTATTVTNPLYQYSFNRKDISGFPSPWNSWLTTIRSPEDPDSPDATTDVQLLISYDFYFT